jgi:hypothetical protein
VLITILAAAAAVAAALALYLLVERVGREDVPLALLRAAAWGTAAVLLVNPGCRGTRAAAVTVLLDGSRSMTDAAGTTRWQAARDTARVLAGAEGRILLFGTVPRLLGDSARPDAPATLLLPALREAAAAGGRLIIVTDGVVDDAASLPADLLAAAQVVLVPRAVGADAGIAALDLPPAFQAADTVGAAVQVVGRGGAPLDSADVELTEAGRVVARTRVAIGGERAARAVMRFVAAPASQGGVRRYTARLARWRDAEPRNDTLATAAMVTRVPAVVVLSDSPDWEVRQLGRTLAEASGVPVRSFVRLDGERWRETATLRAVPAETVERAAADAALVVAHGTGEGLAAARKLARRARWEWPVEGRGAAAGDWYVTAPDAASPVGGALATIPPDSLPPLALVADAAAESTAWVGLAARRDRRGPARPVVAGAEEGARRVVRMGGGGWWQWAAKGGVALEAYRGLLAATADWLLADTERATDIGLVRDSLRRASWELLPREPTLKAQPGTAAAVEPARIPLRHRTAAYGVVIAALVLEWVGRRRRGLR